MEWRRIYFEMYKETMIFAFELCEHDTWKETHAREAFFEQFFKISSVKPFEGKLTVF
jgi:hypothetical protein